MGSAVVSTVVMGSIMRGVTRWRVRRRRPRDRPRRLIMRLIHVMRLIMLRHMLIMSRPHFHNGKFASVRQVHQRGVAPHCRARRRGRTLVPVNNGESDAAAFSRPRS